MSNHDRLHKLGVRKSGAECAQCSRKLDDAIWVLAETREKALNLYHEGSGLCGDCMCDCIEDCEITTPRELLIDNHHLERRRVQAAGTPWPSHLKF